MSAASASNGSATVAPLIEMSLRPALRAGTGDVEPKPAAHPTVVLVVLCVMYCAGAAVMAVVKSDAYGHGLIPVATAAGAISVGAILGSLGHEKLRRKFGTDRLVVADAAEAEEQALPEG